MPLFDCLILLSYVPIEVIAVRLPLLPIVVNQVLVVSYLSKILNTEIFQVVEGLLIYVRVVTLHDSTAPVRRRILVKVHMLDLGVHDLLSGHIMRPNNFTRIRGSRPHHLQLYSLSLRHKVILEIILLRLLLPYCIWGIIHRLKLSLNIIHHHLNIVGIVHSLIRRSKVRVIRSNRKLLIGVVLEFIALVRVILGLIARRFLHRHILHHYLVLMIVIRGQRLIHDKLISINKK